MDLKKAKLKKVVELKSKELLYLVVYANFPVGLTLIDMLNHVDELSNHSKLKYNDLFEKAVQNETYNVFIGVEKDIDQIIFDVFDVYESFVKMKTSGEYDQFLEIEALKRMFDFIPWYENILLTSKFELAKTRTIQKMYLSKLIDIEINRENYEKCAEIKSLIEVL